MPPFMLAVNPETLSKLLRCSSSLQHTAYIHIHGNFTFTEYTVCEILGNSKKFSREGPEAERKRNQQQLDCACSIASRPVGLLAALPWWLHSRSALHGSGLAAQPPRTAPSCLSAPPQSWPLVEAHSGKPPFACCPLNPQCCPQGPVELLLPLLRKPWRSV